MQHYYDDSVMTANELLRAVVRNNHPGGVQLYTTPEDRLYGFMVVDLECTQSQFDDRACEMLARLWVEAGNYKRKRKGGLRFRPAKTAPAPRSNTGPTSAPDGSA